MRSGCSGFQRVAIGKAERSVISAPKEVRFQKDTVEVVPQPAAINGTAHRNCLPRPDQAALQSTTSLVPPKAKLLLTAARTLRSRVTFGVTSRSQSGSGSR